MGLFDSKPVEPQPEKGKVPNMSGDIQAVEKGADGVNKYTLVAKIALWENGSRTGRQPHFTGIISPPEGQTSDTYKVSVWKRK
jgi:hypothetical protein